MSVGFLIPVVALHLIIPSHPYRCIAIPCDSFRRICLDDSLPPSRVQRHADRFYCEIAGLRGLALSVLVIPESMNVPRRKVGYVQPRPFTKKLKERVDDMLVSNRIQALKPQILQEALKTMPSESFLSALERSGKGKTPGDFGVRIPP